MASYLHCYPRSSSRARGAPPTHDQKMYSRVAFGSPLLTSREYSDNLTHARRSVQGVRGNGGVSFRKRLLWRVQKTRNLFERPDMIGNPSGHDPWRIYEAVGVLLGGSGHRDNSCPHLPEPSHDRPLPLYWIRCSDGPVLSCASAFLTPPRAILVALFFKLRHHRGNFRGERFMQSSI